MPTISWKSVVEAYGPICYLCDGKIDMNASMAVGEDGWQLGLHIDHVLPRKFGGGDGLENLRPTHGLCNLRKSGSFLLDYLREHHPEKIASVFYTKNLDNARNPMVFGYFRIDAELESGFDESKLISSYKIDKIFNDIYVGKVYRYPGMDNLKKEIVSGDTVIVGSLVHLGNSQKEAIETISIFKEAGIRLVVSDIDLDTSIETGKKFFEISEAIFNFDKIARSKNTKVGLAKGRARGRVGGRPSKLSEEQRGEVVRLYTEKELSVQTICKMFDIARPTVYNILKNN